MTRFAESAVRNGVSGQTDAATSPLWHASSQMSSLMSSYTNEDLTETGAGHDQMFDYYPPFTESHNVMTEGHNAIAYDIPNGYRPVDYYHFNDLAEASPALSRMLSLNGASSQAVPQPRSHISVKTPTGSRSIRRAGLSGANALVNGHYSCQWCVNGIRCGQKFANAKQLNDHIKLDHVRGADNFECQWEGCDKGSFPTANKLVRHVHSHTGYKPFPCPHCNHAFVTKDQLDKHVTTHTGLKNFVCEWPGCGRSFAVKHALDGHVHSVHLKSKKYVCPHCSQAFDDSSNLSKHKKQVHNRETGIRCPARYTHGCNYVDSRKDKVREHCEREGHGLETINDPHAWNMWVLQFKSVCKKAQTRRQSRETSMSTPMSHASSLSTASFFPTSHSHAASIECTKEDCDIPVCVPCNLMCHDGHAEMLGEPCDDADCDPCDPGCNDPECDPTTRQPCGIQPCNLPHCGSACSSPVQPGTPLISAADSYFTYCPSAGDNELFQNAAHPFQLNGTRQPDWY